MPRLLTTMSIGLALAIIPTPTLAAEDASEPAAKAKKVTDKKDPNYIKCRRESVIGSRAKKRKVCLTNREWEEFARSGNEAARKTVAENASGVTGN